MNSTYHQLTNFFEQSSSSDANSFTVQEILCFFMESDIPLPCSQRPAICPYLEPD